MIHLQIKWLKQCDRVQKLEKELVIGADYLPYLLAEKNLYENQEVIWKNSLADLIR